jgi:hypothetical protein
LADASHLLLLGGHVLAQPDPAPLAGLGAAPQLLLRAGHRVVAVGRLAVVAARIGPSDRAASGLVASLLAGVAGAVVQAVVAPELLLLGLREVAVRVDAAGVFDQLLLVGDLDVVASRVGLGQRDEGRLGTEQTGVDQRPLRLAGLVVDIDGLDGADLVAVPVDHGPPLPTANRVDVNHGGSSLPS